MNTFRKNLRWALPAVLLAGALALAIVAVPALWAQNAQQTMPMQGQRMRQGTMAGGQMSGQMSDQMKARHDQMMQEMKDHMARMDDLMAKMNQATGQAKVDAMAAVLNEMWSERKEMMDRMGGMGPMGGQSMMDGKGMMNGKGSMMGQSGDNPPPQK
jgi:hypothetical protein